MFARIVQRTAFILAAALGALAAGADRTAAQSSPYTPAAAAAMRWRYIGPVGNRVSSVAGVVGDPNTYYAGAASGGLWKTTDGGVHWDPIFDDQKVHSVGALAVARSNPNIVWAGTGEPWIRSHISVGDGVYKSTDAGRTWTNMGLPLSGRIGRVVIHPTNPDIVYVAVQGFSYGPQQERGVYRTTDGGRTWSKVLFVDVNTGAIDVVMDPQNPSKLFAAMWTLEIRTWGRQSGGAGSGIFQSTDGGTTWTRLQGHGLPLHPVGKIGLSISQSNPNRVYALIETADGVPVKDEAVDNGELWRSDDGGTNWKVVSYNRDLACRQAYYTRVQVSTDNPDEAYFMCASFNRTMDGGITAGTGGRGGGGRGRGGAADAALPARGGAPPANEPPMTAPGGDHHDMWIDPTNANRMIVAHDQGVSISTSRAAQWLRVQLPIAQMYHVTTDNRIPYWVLGNRQDGPSYRGPSNSRSGGQIPRSLWHSVQGGESGFATPDPSDSNMVWSTASGSGSRGGIVVRFDLRSKTGANVEVWPQSTGGYAAADVKYRFIWDAPFEISPHDPKVIYTGSQYVHMSNDGGRSWKEISPDLTRNDKAKQQLSGGLSPDNIGVEYADVIHAIAESHVQKGLIWTGSNDGLVQFTRDAGKTWTNVTANVPGMPMWGSVRHVEPGRFAAGTAYIINDAHQENNRDPWVYKTHDFGKTWKLIVNGLPKVPMGYAHIIKEDPVRKGLLYLGTENAIYVSFDDGEQWQPLNLNMPASPVYGITIQEHFNDLVIGTYGRGFWILDDLSPLQKLTAEVAAAPAHLFAPRAAYRFQDVETNVNMQDDLTAGQNPTYGAAINYWLKAAPANAPQITISDAAGKIVRTMNGTRAAGLNRIYWDLANQPTVPPRLRTKPMFNDPFTMDADGTRAAPGFGAISVLMPPGRYSVKLTVDGQSFTQPLTVRKDPNVTVSDLELKASVDAQLQIQAQMAAAGDWVASMEAVRVQVQQLTVSLASDAKNADMKPQVDSVGRKFMDLERSIIDLRQTGQGQDGVRWPTQIAGQLGYLAGNLAGSADAAPTAQQRDVYTVLDRQSKATKTAMDLLIQRDLAALNAKLKERGLKPIELKLPPVVF
ncbi:MAG: sialidase [Gemmatimonadetes bacterium]|nr:sialidase [Gemmatimonadota bacterium]